MEKMRFEKLEIWNDAIVLANNLYVITSNFPSSELYGLVSQIRRAGVSVSANIAEGTGRRTNKDLIHFLHISKGSLYELISLLTIAKQQNLITDSYFDTSKSEIQILSMKITSFINSI
jgi:four helix bundle protein